jgi:hypothetical protein
MKKNTLFFGAVALAVIVCLALSGCEPLEQGIGTVKLTNNSTNVTITYWSLERGSTKIWDEHITIGPGGSATHDMGTDVGIKIYLEDLAYIVGNEVRTGWLSKVSYTVKKNETIEVKFPTDFSPEP